MSDPIFIDFETFAIGPRPLEYPPRPVGLAILDRTKQYESKYYSFGHPTENNCTFEDVCVLLRKIWTSGRSICMHNSLFDMDVIHTYMGLPFLPPELVHDTLTLAFLHDCHAPSLSLKALASSWLGDPPVERDALFEWLVANVPEVKKRPKQSGAFICMGPGALVGEYAMADVRMTAALYDYTLAARQDQAEAYLREISLQPVLLENSRLGVRVDREGMQIAVTLAKIDIAACELWLADFFDEPAINFNSGKQLVDAIVRKGCWNTKLEWPLSAKGTPLTDKDTLSTILTEPHLTAVLRYRDMLSKLCGTYLEPWLIQSKTTGRIYTEWNAVRGEMGGTRTGRLSGRPTLQTMPVRYPITDLPAELKVHGLPKMREFILPDDGHKIISADFNAQELRIFSHFEDGQLAAQYRKDAKADLHQFAADMMSKASGKEVSRTYSKGLSFAILYGAGPAKIADMLSIPYDLARELMDVYQAAVAPGLLSMNEDMRSRYARQAPIRTLGGRLVRGEPPKIVNGRLRKFDYKMTNLLIQGSAADQAKAAMIKYASLACGSRLLLSMHDELVISAEASVAEREATLLTDCMCTALQLDVPMIAESKIGNNYSEVK